MNIILSYFSQIPECTCSIFHNAPFRTEMWTFLFWRNIVGYRKCAFWICEFVQLLIHAMISAVLNLLKRPLAPTPSVKAHATVELYFCSVYPTNPRMHLFHIPQCSIQNRNVHISVLNGALWDMEQVHSGICEFGELLIHAMISALLNLV